MTNSNESQLAKSHKMRRNGLIMLIALVALSMGGGYFAGRLDGYNKALLQVPATLKLDQQIVESINHSAACREVVRDALHPQTAQGIQP